MARILVALGAFVVLLASAAASAAVLRTPDARFAGLPGYAYAPRYAEVPWGGGRVRMHYVDEGPRDGALVLLLHGQPSWSYMYRDVIAGLTAKGFRVVAPDLIGYGRSDKPAAMDDYSYERQLRALDAFVRSRDLRDATLVVHDWGGLLGLPVLAAMPDRFARVALFNTSLNDGTDPEAPAFKAGFDRWIELLRTVPLVEADKVIAAQTARRPPDAVLAAYMAPFPDGRYQSGVRRMSALIPRTPDYPRARENAAVRRFLGTWKKPVLIAFSEDSDRIHPGQFALFNRLFPRDSIWAATKLPGTKHFLFEDRPDLAVEWLAAFAGGKAPPVAEAPPAADPPAAPSLSGERLQRDVETYVGFGDQRTGTRASAETLDWLDGRLRALGYATRRSALPVTRHDVRSAELRVGGQNIADGMPVWPVVWTGARGVAGPLRPLEAAREGDLVYAKLPFSPYASVFDPAYRPIMARIAALRPRAVVAVTEHPTGEVVALNVRGAEESGRAAPRDFPFLLVGQKHAAALDAAAKSGAPVTLTLAGRGEAARAANLVAEAGPPGAKAVVVSTPKNGWFRSGGERGPGVAVALGLAEWLRTSRPDLPVRFVFTSHHELGGAGMKAALADPAFAPDRVRLWLHLGANIATREARATAGGVVRDEAANRQRGLAASPVLVPVLRRAFAHQPALAVEAIEPGRTVGEIALVARAGGYAAAGAVGYQLLHHTRLDDAESTSPAVLEPFARGLAAFLAEVE